MALKILEDCIACDACMQPCPTGAISAADPIYIIDPNICNECVGYADSPTCVDACPVECIVLDEAHRYSYEENLKRYQKED